MRPLGPISRRLPLRLPGRILLPALGALLALTLASCGEEAEVPSGEEPRTPSPTAPASPGSDSDSDSDVVALLSASDAGGTTSRSLTPVGTAAELDTFVSQLDGAELVERVRTEATTTSYQGELHAAVVAVGCDVPPGVVVTEGEDGYEVTPQKVVDPLGTCLVPVTTVALVALR